MSLPLALSKGLLDMMGVYEMTDQRENFGGHRDFVGSFVATYLIICRFVGARGDQERPRILFVYAPQYNVKRWTRLR